MAKGNTDSGTQKRKTGTDKNPGATRPTTKGTFTPKGKPNC